MRVKAREICFKLIFEYDFSRNSSEERFFEIAKNEYDLNEKETQFAYSIFENAVKNYESILSVIEKNLIGFSISRVYKIDLALLVMAISEIKYIKTDAPIVINEILELAKKYSTDKSASFINGVLASVVKE